MGDLQKVFRRLNKFLIKGESCGATVLVAPFWFSEKQKAQQRDSCYA